MKALVTGAGGFIGCRLLSSLLAKGYAVRGLYLPGEDAGAATREGVEVARVEGTTFEERIRALEESLSPFAVRSYETRGRALPEDECGVRTPFQRDRDRVVH